ncbi:hypothetical protein [Helicobacter aurati]|uniref:hypothetical protein n=1 Tax=Helicobacter aurati TaxID=137778 RepID=UPI000E1F227A|nr:hypothetical protein [Helicobacter aurati]
MYCHSKHEVSLQNNTDTSLAMQAQYDKSINCHSEEVRSTTEESQNVESQNDSCHSKPAL